MQSMLFEVSPFDLTGASSRGIFAGAGIGGVIIAGKARGVD
jgi:hypothetical protein